MRKISCGERRPPSGFPAPRRMGRRVGYLKAELESYFEFLRTSEAPENSMSERDEAVRRPRGRPRKRKN